MNKSDNTLNLSNLKKDIPIFAELTFEELNILASVAKKKDFIAKEIIFNEGDYSQSLCVLLKGRVLVTKHDPQKEQVFILQELKMGEIFGDMAFD